MHCAASNIVSRTATGLLVNATGAVSRGHLNYYVLPLKRRRSLVSRVAVHGDGVGHPSGFAPAGEPDAAALEVAGRQSARYLRAGEASAAPTHFTAGECGPAARGASAPAMVSHRVHQHRRRDLAGNTAAA